jgi:hypothetical protein
VSYFLSFIFFASTDFCIMPNGDKNTHAEWTHFCMFSW